MVNYNKIKQLAKNGGIKLSFLCQKIGMYPSYIADVSRKGLSIPDDRLKIIADILNCSVAYLKDETDSPVDEDLLDCVNEIDDDLLEKCGDIFHARIAQEERNKSIKETLFFTEAEKELVTAYRKHPEMQEAVHRLLGITTSDDDISPYADIAAKGKATVQKRKKKPQITP